MASFTGAVNNVNITSNRKLYSTKKTFQTHHAEAIAVKATAPHDEAKTIFGNTSTHSRRTGDYPTATGQQALLRQNKQGRGHRNTAPTGYCSYSTPLRRLLSIG